MIEWERLEISSRKLEIQREIFMQRWAQQRTEMVWTEYTEELYKKDLHDPDHHDV